MDLAILSIEDIEYIARIVPLSDFRAYCKISKKFGTFCPGFRATTLSPAQKEKLIREKFGKSNGFIEQYLSSFLERILKEISDAFLLTKENQTEEIAWLNTVSHSFFAHNPSLLRKLLGGNAPIYTYEEIEIAAIDTLYSIDEANRQLTSENNNIKQSNIDLEKRIEQYEIRIDEISEQQRSLIDDKKRLLQQVKNYEDDNQTLKQREKDLTAEIFKLEKELDDCGNKLSSFQKSFDLLHTEKTSLLSEIKKLQLQLSDVCQQKSVLEHRNNEIESLNSELSKQISDRPVMTPMQDVVLADVASTETEPLIPQDMEYFKDALNYILEDSGISEMRDVLINHLINTIFAGKPIVACRNTAQFLKFILSHIYEEPINTIVYCDSLQLKDIISQIDASGRIVYLDNFIGNYAETYFIPFLPAFKNKIIIFSAAYDAMFKYVSNDFLQYVSYINLERYTKNCTTTIEPQKFDEITFQLDTQYVNEKAVTVFKKRLHEIGFSQNVISSRIQFIQDHKDVQGYFLFEFIPYCVDVLGQNPFYENQNIVAYFENNATANRWFKK